MGKSQRKRKPTKLSNEAKEQLIKDFYTGKFTLQELGDLYGVHKAHAGDLITIHMKAKKIGFKTV